MAIGRMQVSLDGATTRLIALGKAVGEAGTVEATSAKSLLRIVRAIRLYVEAREAALALELVEEVERIGTEIRAEHAHVADAIARHAVAVRKALQSAA